MEKLYSEMTPDERRRDRIAKNPRIKQSVPSDNPGLSLDGIVNRLDAYKQRATYQAVADLVGVPPRGLMRGRSRSPKYSWVVAAANGSDSRRGFPTGYSVNQIHPDCYRQVSQGTDDIIDSAETLKEWLDQRK